jgi:DNA-binding PadR family transcriptional regulator
MPMDSIRKLVVGGGSSTCCDTFILIVKQRFDPQPFLPLPHVHFEILVCLAEHEQHGYSIKREIAVRTSGRIKLGPGSLYGAIGKLTEAGLIEESDSRPDAHLDDERRRYYRLTTGGRSVLRAEAARLRTLVELAEARA